MELIQIIELIAATIGILYVWLELKASIWLWPVGIILPLFYMYISWKSHVYGNIFVNIYYLIACIYGWQEWLRMRKQEQKKDIITRLGKKRRYYFLMITVLFILFLGPVFRRFMESPFPYWDALATSVSLVGMWLLAKKHIENWYCWILSNLIYSVLYFYQGFVITGVFFTVYTGMAIYGYFNWKRMMLNQEVI